MIFIQHNLYQVIIFHGKTTHAKSSVKFSKPASKEASELLANYAYDLNVASERGEDLVAMVKV